LMPAARAMAASIVGNNQKAIRALLDSYHRIDNADTGTGLWMEAESAQAWMRSASGDDIAASRATVIERGRAQARQSI
jgi:enoyl-CoA hydratase